MSDAKKASFYRTRFLMAHNRLHEIAHGDASAKHRENWDEYLAELRTAERIAAKPA